MQTRLLLTLVLLPLACFKAADDGSLVADETGTDTAATDTTETETETESSTSSADTTQMEAGCPLGEADCPCDAGVCDEGLLCVEGVCEISECGNGMLEGDEECDDGNDVDDDECSNACFTAVCGDGVVQLDEECDDANAVDDDMCSNLCVLAVCGDGLIQQGEFCDDGNTNDFDECSNECAPASCGDGMVSGSEECDDGNDVNTDACTNGCLLPFCGDWIMQGNEQCDDGNMQSSDGCSSSCQNECANPGGGNLIAENGVGNNVLYCYNPGDSVQTRAAKACESHFGIGTCCVIMGGYNSQQYGRCDLGGGNGSYHWHWDNHPDGHCPPNYVVGQVVSPGWCGVITGSFLD